MKKSEAELEDDPLDGEIDFSKGVRGKYAADFYKFQNVVILAPDVLQHFPDSNAVNAALRDVIAKRPKTAKRSAKTAAAPRAPKKS